jgi:predicted methyltransferase
MIVSDAAEAPQTFFSSCPMIILSHNQTHLLLQARSSGAGATIISPDLGLSQIEVGIAEDGVNFPEGLLLVWEEVEHIDKNPQACFVVTNEGIEKVQAFSETFNRLYSLMPTAGAPTMLISGIPMHRIKDTDPWRDSQEKVRAAAPKGRVLDTCTGLGYTAILAARRAEHVTTIELDPTVLDICRRNPWSRPLFDKPSIEQRIGDSADLLPDFDDASFDRIIHDPPMFNLAGQLYASDTYRQLHRILKPGGRLFHYIGDPKSRSGRNVTRGVVERLQMAGFRRVVRKPQVFGVVAFR